MLICFSLFADAYSPLALCCYFMIIIILFTSILPHKHTNLNVSFSSSIASIYFSLLHGLLPGPSHVFQLYAELKIMGWPGYKATFIIHHWLDMPATPPFAVVPGSHVVHPQKPKH